MERKTKNIISITIIVLLVIGIILTIHFARVNGSKNFVNDRNIQIFEKPEDIRTIEEIGSEIDAVVAELMQQETPTIPMLTRFMGGNK